jgi:hypothetical protein
MGGNGVTDSGHRLSVSPIPHTTSIPLTKEQSHGSDELAQEFWGFLNVRKKW